MADNKPENVNFDPDSVEVDILILCKNPASFQQAASYLTRRGWPTTVVGNLNKAIDQIVKTNPDFVLLSFNHPNPGTLRLPAILNQSGSTHVIGFTEFADAASAARLGASSMKHKIQGLPSGPNIQRMVRKILMDLFSPHKESSGGAQQHLADENLSESTKLGRSIDEIVAESQSEMDEDTVSTGSYTMGRRKPRKKLKEIVASEPGLQNEDVTATGAANRAQKVDKKTLISLLGDDGKDVRGESNMLFMPSKDEGQDRPNSIIQKGPRRPAQNGPAYMPAEGDEPPEMKVVQEGPGKGLDLGTALQKGRPHKGGHTIITGEESKEYSATSEATHEPQNNIRVLGPQSVGHLKSGMNRSGVLEKAIEGALQEICKAPAAAEVTKPLDEVEVVGVLPVDSADLHGYLLVCASETDAANHIDFLQSLRDSVTKMFNTHGIKADIGDGFVIDMEAFKYREWIKAESTVSFVTYHNEHEIGVSFLPTDRRVPRPRETHHKDMAQIPLAQIDAEQPVNFKTYIHMKKNGKFYLYLRNGRKLFPNQKERLLKGNVEDVFIKSVDIQNYNTYSAAAYISRTIRKTKRSA